MLLRKCNIALLSSANTSTIITFLQLFGISYIEFSCVSLVFNLGLIPSLFLSFMIWTFFFEESRLVIFQDIPQIRFFLLIVFDSNTM